MRLICLLGIIITLFLIAACGLRSVDERSTATRADGTSRESPHDRSRSTYACAVTSPTPGAASTGSGGRAGGVGWRSSYGDPVSGRIAEGKLRGADGHDAAEARMTELNHIATVSPTVANMLSTRIGEVEDDLTTGARDLGPGAGGEKLPPKAKAPVRPGDAPAMPVRPAWLPPPPGQLTAGSWKEAWDPRSLPAFLARTLTAEDADRATALTQRQVRVRVVDAAGRPVGGACVWFPGSAVATSRQDGWASASLPADPQASLTVTVTPAGALDYKAIPVPVAADGSTVITTVAVQSAPTRSLDLALVIDTTGSMGDELQFLKRELSGILATIQARHPTLALRVGIVAYKDVSDEYVTRITPLGGLDAAQAALDGLSAGGGGDEPEALDTALEATAGLAWGEPAPGSVRLALVVADAPAHPGKLAGVLAAAGRLSASGVAVIPVAGSGASPMAEATLRLTAAATGGTYTWLTDDSGIGAAHGEPHVPWYRVEHLNRLLVRLIDGEIRGEVLPPGSTEVIRTVGTPPTDAVVVSPLTAALMQSGGLPSRQTRPGLRLVAWDRYETEIEIGDGGAATVITRSGTTELLRCPSTATTAADGTLIIRPKDAAIVQTPAGPWAPDSFAIAPDGTVRVIDAHDQQATGQATAPGGG